MYTAPNSYRKTILSNSELIEKLGITKRRTIIFLDRVMSGLYTGYERNDNKSKSNSAADVNPLLWELGHVAFFYQYHVCRNLNRYKKTDLEIPKIMNDAKYIFDSFLISHIFHMHHIEVLHIHFSLYFI